MHTLRRVLGASFIAALCGLGAAPSLAGAYAGTNGPTTVPFTQCPAVGHVTSCSFLVELTGSHASPTVNIYGDPSQQYYDANDDELVAVQNDTDGPVASVSLGVASSGDDIFGFDGDGICTQDPKPSGCPFGASTALGGDYEGPDMSFTADPSSQDDGTINFTDMGGLPKGAYTYFGLEAPPGQGFSLPAGGGNNYPTTCLHSGTPSSATATGETNCTNPASGGQPPAADNSPTIATPNPANYYDLAVLHGPNVGHAAGTISYTVYSDSACTQPVADATPSPNTVTNDGFSATIPVSKPVGAALATNKTYYWKAVFTSSNTSGANANSSSTSQCGEESMTFGTPPSRPATGVTTTLSSGQGVSGAQIVVASGQPVTDKAVITGATAATAGGTVTYRIYNDNACTSQITTAFGPKGDTGQVTNGSAAPTGQINTAANPLQVGTYYLTAVYSGDATHAPSTAPCGGEVLSVRKATTLASSFTVGGVAKGPSTAVDPGTLLTDTATVSSGGAAAALATGTVTYSLYDASADPSCAKTPLATGAMPVLGGSAQPFNVPGTLLPGTYKVTASYSGDSTFAPSTIPCPAAEVLTVLPPRVSSSNPTTSGGTIVNKLTINTGGTLTIIGQILNPTAALSRSSAKRCKRGTAKVKGRCVSTSFGSVRVRETLAGTYVVKLAPNRAARAALGRGRHVKVLETITFKPSDGAKAVSTTKRVVVAIRSKHKKRK